MTVYEDLSHLIKTYWSLFLGNIVEWYEFGIYGYLAIYLEKNLFQGSKVGVWLGFGLTFLARPLGGMVLGVLGDVLGRSAALNLSIIGMLVGTCGQGLLPTFANGEVSGKIGLVLLVFLRILQGLSAAGEISTISAYVTEVAPHRSLGRSISLIFMTINVGFLSASSVVFLTRELVGDESMEAWGWRVPFLFALVPGLIAIWGRRHMPESEVFLEAQEQEKGQEEEKGSILGRVFHSYWRNILVGAAGAASVSSVQYVGFIWMDQYLAAQGMSPESRMQVTLMSRVLMILLCLPVGWLADTQGVAWVLLLGSGLLAVSAVPLFQLIAAYPTDVRVVMLSVGVCFSLASVLCSSTFFLFVTELFPVAVRGAGAGISFNLGFAIFGGLAPVIAQVSLQVTPLGPGLILLAGGAITVLAIAAGFCMQRRGLMRMAHVRPKPYLRGCDDAKPAGSEMSVQAHLI